MVPTNVVGRMYIFIESLQPHIQKSVQLSKPTNLEEAIYFLDKLVTPTTLTLQVIELSSTKLRSAIVNRTYSNTRSKSIQLENTELTSEEECNEVEGRDRRWQGTYELSGKRDDVKNKGDKTSLVKGRNERREQFCCDAEPGIPFLWFPPIYLFQFGTWQQRVGRIAATTPVRCIEYSYNNDLYFPVRRDESSRDYQLFGSVYVDKICTDVRILFNIRSRFVSERLALNGIRLDDSGLREFIGINYNSSVLGYFFEYNFITDIREKVPNLQIRYLNDSNNISAHELELHKNDIITVDLKNGTWDA